MPTQSSLTRFLSLLVTTGLLFFTACDDDGLVRGMNQDGQMISFTVEIANVQDQTQGAPFAIAKSGVFDTPIGATAPAPIFPGDAYEISFTAAPSVTPGSGARFSFATMFIPSNDLFYAFPPQGLALFDAGTEVDEEPGIGLNQAIRQAGPDTGTDDNGTVVRVDGSNDGFTYPADDQIIRVTITPAN